MRGCSGSPLFSLKMLTAVARKSTPFPYDEQTFSHFLSTVTIEPLRPLRPLSNDRKADISSLILDNFQNCLIYKFNQYQYTGTYELLYPCDVPRKQRYSEYRFRFSTPARTSLPLTIFFSISFRTPLRSSTVAPFRLLRRESQDTSGS